MFTPIHANDTTQAKPKHIVFNSWKHGAKRAFLDLNIHPRSYLMKRTLLNLVLPGLAVSAIAVALAFPKPNDLQIAVTQATNRMALTEAVTTQGETDVRPLVQDFADVVPGLQEAFDTNAECFLDLDQANAAKIERCAPAVTELIAQVVAYQDNPVVADALRLQDNQRFVQQLQVAAVEVCRSIWSGGGDFAHGLDSPACRVAQVQLAPDIENR